MKLLSWLGKFFEVGFFVFLIFGIIFYLIDDEWITFLVIVGITTIALIRLESHSEDSED